MLKYYEICSLTIKKVFYMRTTLFVLGLPGSGKSTISRYIVNYIRRKHTNQVAKHINDYDILFKEFEEEIVHIKFRPTRKYKGFIVKNPDVYNEALIAVENIVSSDSASEEFAVVEFVRKSYAEAFKFFSRSFVVNNSYFLFLDTDVATCKRRIRARASDPKSNDDHYVPSLVFRLFDVRRNKFYVKTGLKADFGIDDSRITVIQNKGKLQDILLEIEEYVDFMLDRGGITPLLLVGQRKDNK